MSDPIRSIHDLQAAIARLKEQERRQTESLIQSVHAFRASFQPAELLNGFLRELPVSRLLDPSFLKQCIPLAAGWTTRHWMSRHAVNWFRETGASLAGALVQQWVSHALATPKENPVNGDQ